MNEPQMAALLVSHGRPGFYFRVLGEGEVGAGDEIVEVKAGPERVTVAEINALLYLPGHPAGHSPVVFLGAGIGITPRS
jgi:MOSC domain-containing protein YiiM